MKRLTKKPLIILANCPVDEKSMGGGDKIAWEGFARLDTYALEIWGCREALGQVKNSGLDCPLRQISSVKAKKWGVLGTYLLRMITSFFYPELPLPRSIFYSASEFLPDLILPLRGKLKKIPFFWAVGFYLVAKPPGSPENPWGLRAILFYLAQQISILIIRKFADKTYVLAEADKEALGKRGIALSKIEVINGGIDLSQFKKVGKSKLNFEVIFIGRFHRQKGIGDLLYVWEKVVEKLPQAKLVIIGWGGDFWLDLINRAIERLGSDKISFLGFKDNIQKISLLKAAKVLIFPSHYESWGIVTLEAMAAGVPVVAYDIDGLPRDIKENAVLVPSFDKDRMAKEVVTLLSSPQKQEFFSQRGIKISHKFSWGNLQKHLKQTLKDV